jgi:tRNA(fMet)-specific endonuclease VapC
MYLLDTNHCSLAINGRSDIITRLADLDQTKISTCVIVKAELIYMAMNSQNQQTNFNVVAKFFENIFIYGIDSKTAEIYGSVQAKLMQYFGPREKNKRRKTRLTDLGVSQHDLWIASIAIQHDLIVVTMDSDFQRIQIVHDLAVENWYINDS